MTRDSTRRTRDAHHAHRKPVAHRLAVCVTRVVQARARTDTMDAGHHKTGPKWTLEEDQRLEEVVRSEELSTHPSRAAFWSRVARRLGYEPSCSTKRRCARRWAKLGHDAVLDAVPKDALRAAAPSPVDVMRLQDALSYSNVDDASDADERLLVIDLADLLVDDVNESECASECDDLSTWEVLSVTTIGSLSSVEDIGELDEALFGKATTAPFRWDETDRLGRFGDAADAADARARPARAHAQRRAARRALRLAPIPSSAGHKRGASGRVTLRQERRHRLPNPPDILPLDDALCFESHRQLPWPPRLAPPT